MKYREKYPDFKKKEIQRLFPILLLFLIVLVNQNLVAQGIDCCSREAILFCDYDHAFMNNTEREKIEAEFSAAVLEKFQEIFNHDCFQVILPPPLQAIDFPQHEYQIEVKHTQVTNLTNWPGTRIEATLYLVVQTSREPVHFWEVEEAGDSLTVDKISWPSFLEKLAYKIKSGPEITEIIEKHEKRPVSLEIGCDKEEFDPGERIRLYLLSFKDNDGATSREFNRIVVHVSSGKIINGAGCDMGPDYYAFKLDRDLIEVDYLAPENCENPSVKFTIYNSCDILLEQDLYLEQTQTKDRLMEKDFDLNCYDAKIVLTAQSETSVKTSYKDTGNGSSEDYSLNESISASVVIYMELMGVQDYPGINQTWYFYKPTTVDIAGFNYNYDSNRNITESSSQTNINITRSSGKYEIVEKEYVSQSPLILIIDNETGKAVKMIPVPYHFNYEYLETDSFNSVSYSTHGPKRDSGSTTKTSSKTFDFGPVGEEIPDPTIKRSEDIVTDYLQRYGIEIPGGAPIPKVSNEELITTIPPDILVKTGDGKYNLAGEGRRQFTKEIENGYQMENHWFSWTMIIKKRD